MFPIEADAVRFAYQTYTSQQIGIIKLANILNQEGKITPRPGRRQHTTWTQSCIRHILTHPAYYGGPNPDWPFNTPAIVDEEIWIKAQERLKQNRHFKPAEKSNLAFKGKLRCGICGHTLRIGYNHSRRIVYECPGRLQRLHLDGSDRCTLKRFDAIELDASLKVQIESITDNPKEFIKHLTKTLLNIETERDALQARLNPLNGESRKLNEELNILDTRLEVGRIEPDVYRDRVRKIQQRLSELKQTAKDSDPCMIQEFDRINKTTEQCRYLLRAVEKYGLEFIQTWKGLAKEKPLFQLAATKYPELAVPGLAPLQIFRKVLDDMIGIVYPDRIELKGTIGKSDVSHVSERNNLLPLNITLELPV